MIPGFQEAIFIIIALALLAFVIAMIVDVARRPISKVAKAIWIILMLVAYPVAAIVYFFVRNRLHASA